MGQCTLEGDSKNGTRFPVLLPFPPRILSQALLPFFLPTYLPFSTLACPGMVLSSSDLTAGGIDLDRLSKFEFTHQSHVTGP